MIKDLKGNYLFPEIERKKKLFQETNSTRVINLGIGDTTTPLPESIVEALVEASQAMGTEAYQGYGPSFGLMALREAIADAIYQGQIEPDEIYISDGCKPDILRVLLLFGQGAHIGVQELAYPAYVDNSVILGQKVHYIPCPEEKLFVPQFDGVPKLDAFSIISPNNPTGVAYTKHELENAVQYAKRNSSTILFDSAYSSFIQDPTIPKSIYAIDGARNCALEMGSFSKMAGFSGLRLGWTVVPKESPFKKDYERLICTCFNGASLITQKAGIKALGDKQIAKIRMDYLESAAILKETLTELGFTCYGGVHAPYIFAKKNMPSWDLFDRLLNQAAIVTTPGSGFGRAGDGFLRFSAFAPREDIILARKRLLTPKL